MGKKGYKRLDNIDNNEKPFFGELENNKYEKTGLMDEFAGVSHFWTEKYMILAMYLQELACMWSYRWFFWPHFWYIRTRHIRWLVADIHAHYPDQSGYFTWLENSTLNKLWNWSIPTLLFLLWYLVGKIPISLYYIRNWERYIWVLVQLAWLPFILNMCKYAICNSDGFVPGFQCHFRPEEGTWSLPFVNILFFCIAVFVMILYLRLLRHRIERGLVHEGRLRHENYVRSRELEYLLRINCTYRNKRMWMASSFRRPHIFNPVNNRIRQLFFIVVLCGFGYYDPKALNERGQVPFVSEVLWNQAAAFVGFLFFLLPALYCLFKPIYRLKSSNIILRIVMVTNASNAAAGVLRAAEVNNPLLVDDVLVNLMSGCNILALLVILVLFFYWYFYDHDWTLCVPQRYHTKYQEVDEMVMVAALPHAGGEQSFKRRKLISSLIERREKMGLLGEDNEDKPQTEIGRWKKRMKEELEDAQYKLEHNHDHDADDHLTREEEDELKETVYDIQKRLDKQAKLTERLLVLQDTACAEDLPEDDRLEAAHMATTVAQQLVELMGLRGLDDDEELHEEWRDYMEQRVEDIRTEITTIEQSGQLQQHDEESNPLADYQAEERTIMDKLQKHAHLHSKLLRHYDIINSGNLGEVQLADEHEAIVLLVDELVELIEDYEVIPPDDNGEEKSKLWIQNCTVLLDSYQVRSADRTLIGKDRITYANRAFAILLKFTQYNTLVEEAKHADGQASGDENDESTQLEGRTRAAMARDQIATMIHEFVPAPDIPMNFPEGPTKLDNMLEDANSQISKSSRSRRSGSAYAASDKPQDVPNEEDLTKYHEDFFPAMELLHYDGSWEDGGEEEVDESTRMFSRPYFELFPSNDENKYRWPISTAIVEEIVRENKYNHYVDCIRNGKRMLDWCSKLTSTPELISCDALIKHIRAVNRCLNICKRRRVTHHMHAIHPLQNTLENVLDELVYEYKRARDCSIMVGRRAKILPQITAYLHKRMNDRERVMVLMSPRVRRLLLKLLTLRMWYQLVIEKQSFLHPPEKRRQAELAEARAEREVEDILLLGMDSQSDSYGGHSRDYNDEDDDEEYEEDEEYTEESAAEDAPYGQQPTGMGLDRQQTDDSYYDYEEEGSRPPTGGRRTSSRPTSSRTPQSRPQSDYNQPSTLQSDRSGSRHEDDDATDDSQKDETQQQDETETAKLDIHRDLSDDEADRLEREKLEKLQSMRDEIQRHKQRELEKKEERELRDKLEARGEGMLSQLASLYDEERERVADETEAEEEERDTLRQRRQLKMDDDAKILREAEKETHRERQRKMEEERQEQEGTDSYLQGEQLTEHYSTWPSKKLKEEKKKMMAALNEWKAEWARNNGREPLKKDIVKEPEIAGVYSRYRAISDLLKSKAN